MIAGRAQTGQLVGCCTCVRCYLRLPRATLDTRVSEIVEEQLALTDYRLKVQAKGFRDFLAGVQEVRQGVRDARHKSAG